ncbi:receptor-interacting serine serine/threonine-protein kinase 1-like [Octopus vulgaris]|uniref:Receptor-interacting serine serine/threonine-protein kinase 1-like n=1 Tax=Octopus vulgaris TaxID=6645 RepID=A0AA36FKP8_OCTVU|nr:receptor-interacting serine serine/threonine-protein kinase 1-like [Octopus vulgaris]
MEDLLALVIQLQKQQQYQQLLELQKQQQLKDKTLPANTYKTNSKTVTSSSNSDALLSSEDVKGNNNAVPKPTGEGNDKIREIPKSNETNALPPLCNNFSKNTCIVLPVRGASSSYAQEAACLPIEESKTKSLSINSPNNQLNSANVPQMFPQGFIPATIRNGKNVAVGGDSNVTNTKTAEPEKKKCETDKDEVKFSKYLKSNTKLTQKHLNKIAAYLGNKWKSVGRNLDIQDVFLGNIESDNPQKTEEECFQMLKKWSEISEPGMCTTGKLAKALIDAECYGVIPYLPLDEE